MDRTPAPLPQFLDPAEVAACTRLSLNVVYRLINDRQLPAVKIRNRWRIRRQDVETLMATGTA